MTGAIVIGIGNPYRRDDGVGPAAVDRLAAALPDTKLIVLDGEPTRLVDAWAGRRLAIVVDAIRAGDEPGAIHRLEVGVDPLPAAAPHASTHGPGIAAAVALGRAVGLMPARLVVYGVEPATVGNGTGLTPPVTAALPDLTRQIAAGGAVDMCLSQVIRITEVSPDGATAVGFTDGREATVSLAVLTLDGTPVRPGDWVIAATGLAVEKISAAEATQVTESRFALIEESS